MKTLQNNFTTSEQSKRLLKLGVPADSADCVFMRGYSSYGKDEFVVPFYKTDSIVSFFKDHDKEDTDEICDLYLAPHENYKEYEKLTDKEYSAENSHDNIIEIIGL